MSIRRAICEPHLFLGTAYALMYSLFPTSLNVSQAISHLLIDNSSSSHHRLIARGVNTVHEKSHNPATARCQSNSTLSPIHQRHDHDANTSSSIKKIALKLGTDGPVKTLPTPRKIQILFNGVYIIRTINASYVWEHPYVPKQNSVKNARDTR